MTTTNDLQALCRLIRYDILTSTTEAGSGHATSSLSAVELAAVLFFGGFFRQDLKNPKNLQNDRFILSKGHASPLLYSLYQAAGAVSHEELMTLRKFDSPLQGHPTPEFPYVDVATGSLGQGLSLAVGMLLGLRLKKLSDPRLFVLIGDSEFAEGQNWEALEIASFYKLKNLIGILDVNRLGQSRETLLGWDVDAYEKRISSFGWNTVVIEDGNDIGTVQKAYKKALALKTEAPTMLIAKTVKGSGVSLLENEEGWHGKPLPKDRLEDALKELGNVDLHLKGTVAAPNTTPPENTQENVRNIQNPPLPHEPMSTREAYGEALALVGQYNPNIISLDGEVSNSTFSEMFRKVFPDRYFEMFIAEQNMISTAVGASKMGLIPFVSTFAAFFSRAFDQIRMSQYSKANLKLVGSHSGVSIGEDGPSQMALEDLAMMRSVLESTILYPADAVATVKLVQLMAERDGLIYLRINRPTTPIIYSEADEFEIGGSKILSESESDTAVIFTAGITVHEALKAKKTLAEKGVSVAVVDLYCVKPLDEETVKRLSLKTGHVVVVEDHYPDGGLGDAVKEALTSGDIKFSHLAVKKTPRSGKTEELLSFEEIDANAIISAVMQA